MFPIHLSFEHRRALEHDDSPGIQQDTRTRSRVPSFPLILASYTEFAESADQDVFASFQRLLDDFEGRLDRLPGLGVREIQLIGNGMYDSLFGEGHNEGLPRAPGPVSMRHQNM